MATGEATTTDVYLEIGKRRVFASAADWPGWCCAGRDEKSALEALAAAAPRYAAVAKAARIAFPSSSGDGFTVVERLLGDAATEFGVPGQIAKGETRPLAPAETRRIVALLAASWTVLDRAVAKAPAALRKGPKGGGRDRDEIVEHVLGAESAYVRKLGLRLQQPAAQDAAEVREFRDAMVAAIKGDTTPPFEAKWPVRYFARRAAWHALDHAWEMEDKS